MKCLIRLASALYPSSWRRRYGPEFEALLDEVKPGLRQLIDVLKGAIAMQLRAAQSSVMRICFRIIICASAGFFISAGWGLYFATADKARPIHPVVYALVYISEPVAGITYTYFDFPRGLRAFEIENAATYSLIGLMLTMVRRRDRPLQISN
jgi:hypothetical protein